MAPWLDRPFFLPLLTNVVEQEFSEVPEETFIVNSSSPFRVHTGRGTTKLPLSTFPTAPLELMHPTSEKRNSQKFPNTGSSCASATPQCSY
jgi:hypothetical protein